MKKIVFFYKNKIEIPKVLRDYFLMSPKLIDENTEVWYINYSNDGIVNDLSKGGVKYFDVESEDYSEFNDAVFICPLNYIFILADKIKHLKNAKILALNWKQESVPLFTNQLNVFGIPVQRFYKEICCKKGVASKDKDKKIILKSVAGEEAGKSCYVTIPSGNIEKGNTIPLKNDGKLSVAWIGDINSYEINAVRNIADNIMEIEKCENVDFHIIGEGSSKFRIDLKKYSPKIRFIYTSVLSDGINEYCKKYIDVAFACEKDVFTATSIGIPVVIPPLDSETYNINKYVFPYDTDTHTLSWTPQNLKILKYPSYHMDDVLRMISDEKTREEIVTKEKKYISNEFSEDIAVEQLKNAINGTELGIRDIMAIPEVSEVMKKSDKYDKEFLEYFNYRQEKYNIACGGIKAKVSNAARKTLNGCMVPAKYIKHRIDKKKSYKWYNNVQNSYEEKIKNIQKIYKKNGKLKVAFLLIFDSVFPGEPVFENMLEDNIFDPYIIVMPDVDRQREYTYHMATYEKTLKAMKERYGDRVIEGYDREEDEYYDLGEKYQIVFFANPYKHMAHKYHEVEYFLDKNVLPLYICYGYAAVKYARGLLELDFYNLVWKVFLESYSNYEDYKKYQPVKGRNAMVSGYIKMDKLATTQIVKRKRKKILICPHHTVMGWNKLNISNFLQYAELFVKLPKMYPQIDFVFRPHPLLFNNLLEKHIWSKERINDYMERLLANENMIYDNQGDYYETFANSDGMIHDCGSFIGEYLYTEKPCCYMLKSPEDLKTVFLPIGEMCMENYYKAYNEKDIIKFIDDVIVNGNDTLKDQREAFCKNTLKINYPHATEQVIKCIKDAVIK